MTGTRREPGLGPVGASDWLGGRCLLLRLRPHWARGAASGTSKRVLLALRLSLAGGSPESAGCERGDAGTARDPSSFPEQPPGSAPLPAPPRSPGTCYGHVYTRGKSKRGNTLLLLTGVIFRYGFSGSAAPENCCCRMAATVSFSTFHISGTDSKLLETRRCLCKKMIC